ncbi:MAG: membrane protein insertion efficiency factor YidD [Clostridia bacterium]|nr:membrane protein insertion efficiency factor YidD [Clostridia bacterium]
MRRVAIALIRFYQKHLSGLKRHPSCRFVPTCSAYAVEAFERRGFFAGFVLSIYRLLRCQPFCRGGYDPVPDTGFGRQNKIKKPFAFDATAFDPDKLK